MARKIDNFRFLQVRAFKLKKSEQFKHNTMKLSKKLTRDEAQDKLIHMKCGVCEISYLPKDLPYIINTSGIQQLFEQSNRLGEYLIWINIKIHRALLPYPAPLQTEQLNFASRILFNACLIHTDHRTKKPFLIC